MKSLRVETAEFRIALDRRPLTRWQYFRRRLRSAYYAFLEADDYDVVERKVYPGDPEFEHALGVAWHWIGSFKLDGTPVEENKETQE